MRTTVFLTERGRGPRADDALIMGNEELYEVEEMEAPPRADGLPPPGRERLAVVLALPPGRRGGVGAGRDGVRDERLLYAMTTNGRGR